MPDSSALLPLPFRPVVPVIEAWLRHTLAAHASRARPVASFGFPRLGLFYSPDLLARAKVVITDALPVPAVPSFGLAYLKAFNRGTYSGITLEDTFFVREDRQHDQGLFFHELVHVVQWQHLGRRPFIHRYGRELLRGGYANNDLELMAYEHGARFERGEKAFDVEAEVRAALDDPEWRPRVRFVRR